MHDWYILVGENLTAYGTFKHPFSCVKMHLDDQILLVNVLKHIIRPDVFQVCPLNGNLDHC